MRCARLYLFGPVSQTQPARESHIVKKARENGNMAIYNAIMRAEVKLQNPSRSRYHHGLVIFGRLLSIFRRALSKFFKFSVNLIALLSLHDSGLPVLEVVMLTGKKKQGRFPYVLRG